MIKVGDTVKRSNGAGEVMTVKEILEAPGAFMSPGDSAEQHQRAICAWKVGGIDYSHTLHTSELVAAKEK